MDLTAEEKLFDGLIAKFREQINVATPGINANTVHLMALKKAVIIYIETIIKERIDSYDTSRTIDTQANFKTIDSGASQGRKPGSTRRERSGARQLGERSGGHDGVVNPEGNPNAPDEQTVPIGRV